MANQSEEYEENQWQDEQAGQFKPKTGNNLPIWGNPRTMNLNHLVLTNIQNSSYFKVRLFELKTYHEVVDEIYYKVGLFCALVFSVLDFRFGKNLCCPKRLITMINIFSCIRCAIYSIMRAM